jgi:hypothetical protein
MDPCQLVHKGGGDYCNMRAFPEEEGQEEDLLVLGEQDVVYVAEEGEVGLQPPHLHPHLRLPQTRLALPREGRKIVQGRRIEEGEAQSLEGERVVLPALSRQLQRVQLYHIIQSAIDG